MEFIKSKSKMFKITAIVVVVILTLLIFAGYSGNKVDVYSKSDLISETSDNITFLRPSQWKDASGIEKLKKDFGMEASNAKIYGDKIKKNKDGEQIIPNAFVLFGKISDETLDVSVFKDSAVKAQLEKNFDSSVKEENFKSGQCATVEKFKKNYNYGVNNFPLSVAISFNCQLSEANKKKEGVDSYEVRMAIVYAASGKSYIYTLIASDKSWAKNEAVYMSMLEGLKVQK